ncbi:MAG: TonB family protein [Bacteroidales bacterium]
MSLSNKYLQQEDTIFFEIPNDVPGYGEDYPAFPGGDNALIIYVKENTRYPQSAIKDSIEGRVILGFAIDVDGSTSDIKALRGVRKDLDEECIRVVKEMPKWKPGRTIKKSNKGWYWTTVKFWYSIPFTFSLSNYDNKKKIIITPR